MSAPTPLVFFGSGEFGLPTLARLASEHDLLAVVTQPDRPAGRTRRPTPTPIAQWAGTHAPALPVLKPERVNDPSVVERIRAFAAPAFVVIAFGQKIGRPILEGRFAVNLHASLLPRWRGAAPIHHAILAGDAETGNSVITLADRMDAGSILGQSRRAIEPRFTAGELHDLLAGDGPALVSRVLAQQETRTLVPVEQDEGLVTLAPKLSKADGWVDFGAPAEACRRRVHGLTPWPGVAVGFREEMIKIIRVTLSPVGSPEAPGTIIEAEGGIVSCGSGTRLQVLEVLPPGGRVMDWPDFARGKRVRADEMLVGGRLS